MITKQRQREVTVTTEVFLYPSLDFNLICLVTWKFSKRQRINQPGTETQLSHLEVLFYLQPFRARSSFLRYKPGDVVP